MTKEQIVSLSTDQLWSIVRSTRSEGKFWLELVYAKDELQRRAHKSGKHLVGL